MTARTRLTGVHHIGFHSTDPTRLLAFYRDVFCVEPHPLSDPRIRACAWFAVGRVLIEVIPAAQPGPDHVAFAVADQQDLLDLRARLLAAGHHAGEVQDLGAVCRVEFHDPEGRRGELVWAGQPSVRP